MRMPVFDRYSAGAEKAAAAMAALAESNWSAKCEAARLRALSGIGTAPMPPDLAMLRIVEALPKDAVIVEEGILSARPAGPLSVP